MLADYKNAIKNAIDRIKNTNILTEKTITIFHHNDTDGLSSGAILQSVFQRKGYKTKRYALEKPYPQVLQKIFESKGQLIILADFAGMAAQEITEINQDRNLIVIIDHHPAVKPDSSKVFNLDGALFGLKGDRDISASASCYLFAEAFDNSNIDLAHLGTLGAIGDGFFVNGALSSVNRMVMERAVKQGRIIVKKLDNGESYSIKLNNKIIPAEKVCSILDSLGGAGYYSGRADIGVNACLNGFSKEIIDIAESLLQKQNKIFKTEIENIKNNGMNETAHIQWFDLKDRFSPMGVKMVGVFCNYIRNEGFIDKTKYLAGFQFVPDEIPGFGRINFNSTKISMRVSSDLTKKIRNGEKPGLSSFLPEATKNIGGFADACHSLSAATIVKKGQEEELIKEMEKVLGSLNG